MRRQSCQLPPHRFGGGVCGIVARLGLEPTVDRVTREWSSALRAMESDFYSTAMTGVYIWYTLTYMVAARVTDLWTTHWTFYIKMANIAPNKTTK